MQLIDIHTHIYPDEIAQKATDSIKSFYQLGGGGMDGTERMLLNRGAQAGISRYVVLPVAIRPDRVQGINDFICQRVRHNDAFVGFGTVHAAMESPEAEAERIRRLGLRGIKMHPDSQRFAIDDPRLFPMYDAIAGKLPVILHMGDHRYDYSHPLKLRRVLDLFPKLQVIAAHFGGYSIWDQAVEALAGLPNLYVDCSSAMPFLTDDKIREYIRRYGEDRVLFGTDYPMWTGENEVPRLLSLGLSDEAYRKIFSENIIALLGL